MTYLEKLLLLNRNIFRRSAELLAAKIQLSKIPLNSPLFSLSVQHVNLLLAEYQQAIMDSKNMKFYINLNHIKLHSILFKHK